MSFFTLTTCLYWRQHWEEFQKDLWHQKIESTALAIMPHCLTVLIEHWLVTDRGTDGRTQGYSIHCTSIYSHTVETAYGVYEVYPYKDYNKLIKTKCDCD